MQATQETFTPVTVFKSKWTDAPFNGPRIDTSKYPPAFRHTFSCGNELLAYALKHYREGMKTIENDANMPAMTKEVQGQVLRTELLKFSEIFIQQFNQDPSVFNNLDSLPATPPANELPQEVLFQSRPFHQQSGTLLAPAKETDWITVEKHNSEGEKAFVESQKRKAEKEKSGATKLPQALSKKRFIGATDSEGNTVYGKASLAELAEKDSELAAQFEELHHPENKSEKVSIAVVLRTSQAVYRIAIT